MKINCITLRWSVFLTTCSFISVIGSLIFLPCFENLISLFIGIFSSSLVALLFYLPSYLISKKQTFNKFWSELFPIIKKIYHVRLVFCEFDTDDIEKYVHLLNMSNSSVPMSTNQKRELEEIENQLLNTYRNRRNQRQNNINDISVVRSYVKNIRNEAKIAYKQYIDLSALDIHGIEMIRADMKFFWSNKLLSEIDKGILQPLYNYLNTVNEYSSVFEVYSENKSNESYYLKHLLNLQSKFFDLKINNKKEYTIFSFKSEFLEGIMEGIGYVWKKVYGKEFNNELFIIQRRTSFY